MNLDNPYPFGDLSLLTTLLLASWSCGNETECAWWLLSSSWLVEQCEKQCGGAFKPLELAKGMPQLARTLKAICVAPTESVVFTYMYNDMIIFCMISSSWFNHKGANC